MSKAINLDGLKQTVKAINNKIENEVSLLQEELESIDLLIDEKSLHITINGVPVGKTKIEVASEDDILNIIDNLQTQNNFTCKQFTIKQVIKL